MVDIYDIPQGGHFSLTDGQLMKLEMSSGGWTGQLEQPTVVPLTILLTTAVTAQLPRLNIDITGNGDEVQLL